MNVLGNGNRPVPGGFAPRVGKRMAGLDPLHARWQIRVGMSADGECLPDREVRCRGKRCGHRGRSLADGNDVQSARGEHVGDVAIGKRARQDTTGADCVYTRADDVIEVLSEAGNGNRQ